MVEFRILLDRGDAYINQGKPSGGHPRSVLSEIRTDRSLNPRQNPLVTRSSCCYSSERFSLLTSFHRCQWRGKPLRRFRPRRGRDLPRGRCKKMLKNPSRNSRNLPDAVLGRISILSCLFRTEKSLLTGN